AIQAQVNKSEWGVGGDNRRIVESGTALIQGLISGDVNKAVANASAPYIANYIGQHIEDDKAKVAAHGIANVALALAKGENAGAQSLGAMTAEAVGMLSKELYKKDVSQLTEDEKATVSAFASLAAGIAGGLVGGDTSSAGNAAQAGKTTVENNHLSPEKTKTRSEEFTKCNGDSSCRAEVRDTYRKEYDKVQEQINNCSSPDQCVAVAKELKEWQKIYSERAKELQDKAHNNSGIGSLTDAEQKEWAEIRGTIPNLEGSRNLAIYRAELLGGSEETTKERDLAMAAAGIGAGIGNRKSGQGTTGKQTNTSKVEAEKNALNKIGENSKNTKDLSQKEANTVYNQQLALLDKQAAKSNVVIDPNKVKYLFGEVNSNKHNSDRSTQMEQSMRRLGIPTDEKGDKYLTDHLSNVPKTQGNIVKVYSDKYGKYEVRESLLFGPSGKATKLETLFQIMPDGTRRFVTTIPKEGKK
ncbi:VENN motif pre-toxin domain-containing protein, partial [Providencia huaxiensis]|uniref:VENN motif pre-toxin domain-containing protein n=1 Tax=Providencia huaxiensis TaxID=2027290 RepID=UPI0034E4D88B